MQNLIQMRRNNTNEVVYLTVRQILIHSGEACGVRCNHMMTAMGRDVYSV